MVILLPKPHYHSGGSSHSVQYSQIHSLFYGGSESTTPHRELGHGYSPLFP